jgi:toxin YoeB
MKIEKTAAFVRDYCQWPVNAPQLSKIDRLILAISFDPICGIGKPERLKNTKYWSRRIDGKNRLIYCIKGDTIILIRCQGHYSDH